MRSAASRRSATRRRRAAPRPREPTRCSPRSAIRGAIQRGLPLKTLLVYGGAALAIGFVGLSLLIVLLAPAAPSPTGAPALGRTGRRAAGGSRRRRPGADRDRAAPARTSRQQRPAAALRHRRRRCWPRGYPRRRHGCRLRCRARPPPAPATPLPPTRAPASCRRRPAAAAGVRASTVPPRPARRPRLAPGAARRPRRAVGSPPARRLATGSDRAAASTAPSRTGVHGSAERAPVARRRRHGSRQARRAVRPPATRSGVAGRDRAPRSPPHAGSEPRATVASASPPPGPPPMDHFGLALYYQRVGDFDNALAQYRTLLEQNDASAEVHNNLGPAVPGSRPDGRRDQAVPARDRDRSALREGAQQSRRRADARRTAGRGGRGIPRRARRRARATSSRW